jgi:hypothetical protein
MLQLHDRINVQKSCSRMPQANRNRIMSMPGNCSNGKGNPHPVLRSTMMATSGYHDSTVSKPVVKWENKRRFSQTASTPFMTSPLLDDFGYLSQGLATLWFLLERTSRCLVPTFMLQSFSSKWIQVCLLRHP